MRKLRVLIVDDEYPARMELRHYLSNFDNLNIVGEASNANEAYQLILAMNYDVIFLDIRMPNMSGIELVQALQSLEDGPKIVFVTAYEDYALQAFKVKAFDYILKPIEADRLQEVIARLEKEFGKREVAPKISGYLQFIPGELKGTIHPVKVTDIIYIYSEREGIYIKVKQGDNLLTRFTIKELEQRLDPAMFFRCHRCVIVNLNYVNEIRPGFHGAFSLIMQDRNKTELPVSRGQAKILKQIFHI